jgi:hypothetical protein
MSSSYRIKGHSFDGDSPFPNSKPLTFRSWLLRNAYRCDPIGTLARSVRRNGGWPAGAAAEAEYMLAQGADPIMLAALSLARQEYKRFESLSAKWAERLGRTST